MLARCQGRLWNASQVGRSFWGCRYHCAGLLQALLKSIRTALADLMPKPLTVVHAGDASFPIGPKRARAELDDTDRARIDRAKGGV